MFEKNPIADVNALYEVVPNIAAWLRSHGHVEWGTQVDQSMLWGSSGLEVTGEIRSVLREVLSKVDLKDDAIIAEIKRCIRFIDYVWDDPVRDDNPYRDAPPEDPPEGPPLVPTEESEIEGHADFVAACHETARVLLGNKREWDAQLLTRSDKWGVVWRADFAAAGMNLSPLINRVVCWQKPNGAFHIHTAIGQNIPPLRLPSSSEGV